MKKYIARCLRATADRLDPRPARPLYGDVHIAMPSEDALRNLNESVRASRRSGRAFAKGGYIR